MELVTQLVTAGWWLCWAQQMLVVVTHPCPGQSRVVLGAHRGRAME